MAIISLDMMDLDMRKSVFSASLIMVLILSLSLLSKIIAIILIVCFGLLTGVMGYNLFIKKYVIGGRGSVQVSIKEK